MAGPHRPPQERWPGGSTALGRVPSRLTGTRGLGSKQVVLKLGSGPGSGGPAFLPQHTGLPRPHGCQRDGPPTLEKPQVHWLQMARAGLGPQWLTQ